MQLATLCYIKKNQKTLMLHRIKKQNDIHEGKWNGLGGKFESGETPEECVIREVKEESGLEITNPKLHGIILFPNFDGIKDWFVFVFSSTQFNGEIIESDEGILKWINDELLFSLNLWEGDKIFMDWIKRCHRPGLTLERLDDTEAHHKSNCVLACKSCNSRKLSKEKSLMLRYFRKWYRATFDVVPQFTNQRRCTFVI